MFRYLRLIVAFLFFVIVLGMRPFVVDAQNTPAPPTPAYNGLNVLLGIDQSSSMGGPPFGGPSDYGPAGTDPNGLRFTGPQYAVMHMGYLRQALSTAQTEINIALMAFGTDMRPISDWQTIDNTTNWDATLDDLSEERWLDRNLGQTNFEGFFSSADAYFNRAPSTPGITYRNVILLLTDGAPCNSNDPAFQEQADDGRIVYNCLLPGRLDAMEAHLERLYDFTSSRFVPPNFEIYVIALDVGIPQPYWTEFEDEWADIVCNGQATCDPALRYRKVDDANQIGQQINLIINDALQGVLPTFNTQAVTIPPGQFNVKPFQQGLRVDVFKLTPDPTTASFTVNGQPPSDTPQIDSLATIDMYTFELPATGTWTINLTTQVAGVQYSTIPPVVKVEGLDADGEAFSAIPIKFTLSKNDGTALTVDPNYPPNLVNAVARIYDATLSDRDQRPMLAEIPLTDLADGTYSYQGEWTPLKDGVYEVRVTASYLNSSGQPETIVNDQTVKDRFEVVGAFVEWQGIKPVSERADKPFMVSGIVKNALTSAPIRNTSALKLHLTLVNPDGTIYKDEIVPNRGQAPGEVLASFQVDTGIYQGSVEVVYDDGVNPPQVLGNASIPQQIEARAVHPLQLQMILPLNGVQDAQRFNLWPFELDLNVSVPVQLVLLDTFNNQYVSLAAASNGTEILPSFTVDGETIQLVELQPGVYITQLNGLSMGEHLLAANVFTADTNLSGDYIWASPVAQSTQTTINRAFSGSLALAILALVLIVALAGGVGFILWRRSVWLAQNPLKGTLVFGVADGYDEGAPSSIPNATFDFSGMKPQHTYTFKNVPLPGSFKRINKVTISTKREPLTSERAEAYITELIIDGETITPRKLFPSTDWTSLKTSGDGTQSLKVIKQDVGGIHGGDWLGGIGRGFGKSTEISGVGGKTRPGWGGDTRIES